MAKLARCTLCTLQLLYILLKPLCIERVISYQRLPFFFPLKWMISSASSECCSEIRVLCEWTIPKDLNVLEITPIGIYEIFKRGLEKLKYK